MHIVREKPKRETLAKFLIDMKGGDIMDLTLKRDIRKLMVDTEDVKRALDMLEQDHATWARKREEKDLKKIIERVKGLEFDVSTMMSDCSSLPHQEESKGINEDLHQAFRRLNALFEDIKEVRSELNGSYIHAGELWQLEIDWGRFRKTIREIQKHLQAGENSPRIKKEKIIFQNHII